MTTPLKTDLEPLPIRMTRLPIDARGYPVPWFVAWVPGPDGVNVPEFRAQDARKFVEAIKGKRCWVCGDTLGRWLAFPIGPMCSITRTISEPPSHLDCATWSIRNCPFLSNPNMARRDDNLPRDYTTAGGFPITRNPGVMCLWLTRSFEVFDAGDGKPLITLGEPAGVTWWREGRTATRAEVEASINSGLPALLGMAQKQGTAAIAAFEAAYVQAKALLPAVTP